MSAVLVVVLVVKTEFLTRKNYVVAGLQRIVLIIDTPSFLSSHEELSMYHIVNELASSA
jgi:hypothetical protein